MADEVIGAARIDIIVGTDQMDVAIERAKSRVSSMSAEAQKAYTGLNAAEKKRIDSLIKQADTIGFTREQQILYNAALKGTPVAILDELKAKMGGVKASTEQAAAAATKGFSGTGKSARELQFAMRGLPAQFTDIFTSLASGQRPMMVLLQQGGQIKDMFGGVGPALRAMGSGILAMINPLTLSAAAVGALALAWTQAENNATAFNKALLVTGGYAGKTTSQLEAMVGSIAAATDATQGTAREAIQKVAETGRFTGAQFDLVAVAAARMESATGQSIDDTIKKFEELAKAPVEGLLKLNETEHFLTQAQLERVQALMAEGKEQEAAAEAARIYAGRLDEVGAAAEAARPHLSQMWKDAKEGASDAWEETKRFTEFLAAAADKYKEMPWYKRMTFVGAISSLRGAEPVVPASVAPVAGAVDSNQARATAKLQEDAAKFKDRYLTREQEKTRELAELDKLRAQYSEQEYQNLKKQIDLEYADKGAAKQAKFFDQPIGMDQRAELAKSMSDIIAGYKKEAEQWSRSTAAAAAYKSTLDDMLDTRQRAIDLQVASIGMGRREIDQQQALIGIDEDYNRKKAELQKRQQNTTSALERDGYQQQLDDLAKYHDKRVKMEIDGWRRADEARKSMTLGARAAILDFEDNAGNVAGQTYDVFTNAFDGMADSLANFVLKGKGNFSDLVESFIADMVKMEARILASQLLMSIFGNFNGGAGNAASVGVSNGRATAFNPWANAKGGVYDLPSLSAYSGQIVNKPTMFAFARGAGLMGEASPEAIMPLRRGPDGRLGVQAAGAGDVQVEINITNQGQPVQAQQTGQRMDGKKLIIDMAIQAVAADMAKGGPTAQAAQQRFGLSRRGVPVGG